MSHKTHLGFPTLSDEEQFENTRPMGLDELPRQHQIDRELDVVRTYHDRISRAIDVFWGHKDCVAYLETLILNGGDGFGNARIGFRKEVMSALLNLVRLHQEEYR
jgi:hypothetical protein